MEWNAMQCNRMGIGMGIGMEWNGMEMGILNGMQ